MKKLVGLIIVSLSLSGCVSDASTQAFKDSLIARGFDRVMILSVNETENHKATLCADHFDEIYFEASNSSTRVFGLLCLRVEAGGPTPTEMFKVVLSSDPSLVVDGSSTNPSV